MRFGKRRQDADAPDPPDATKSVAGSAAPVASDDVTVAVTEPPPLADRAAPASDEPAVEGEAVELPPNEPAAPVHEPPLPPPGGAATRPDPMPFPVADEPVAVVTPGAGASAPVTSLGASGEAFASGHAAAPGPSWQEPVMELANERPELVVAAAFAGGVLAAMILRRLGS